MKSSLFILCLLIAGLYSHKFDVRERIIDGWVANIKEVPYEVALVWLGKTLCGASILSARWCLTAGHCIVSTDFTYEIRAGHHMFHKGLSFPVAEAIVYPDYEAGAVDGDLGLLDLGDNVLPLDGIFMKPVRLVRADYEAKVGQRLLVAGWGMVKARGAPVNSKVLKQRAVHIVERSECEFPSPQMYCVTHGTLNGDSGSPVMLDDNSHQIGIVSLSCLDPPCNGEGNEVVNLGHPDHRKWIASVTDI